MRNLTLCLLVAPTLLTACNTAPTRQQAGTSTGSVTRVVVAGGSTLGTIAAAGGVSSTQLASNTDPDRK